MEKLAPGRQIGAPRPQNGDQGSPKGAGRDAQSDPVAAKGSQRRPQVYNCNMLVKRVAFFAEDGRAHLD